jgi:hypothetical protein
VPIQTERTHPGAAATAAPFVPTAGAAVPPAAVPPPSVPLGFVAAGGVAHGPGPGPSASSPSAPTGSSMADTTYSRGGPK